MAADTGESVKPYLGETSAPRLNHPAFDPGLGAPLGEASLSDSQRVAVLFQGACAMAHLEDQGWTVGSWSSARAEGAGLLSGLVAVPLDRGVLPQERLLGLLRELFQTREAPAGRGQARRAARDLVASWRQSVNPIAAARTVEEILERAPFLWKKEFAGARRCLVGAISKNGDSRLRVLGPRHFAQAVSAGTEELAEVSRRLAAPDARALWRAAPRGRAPEDLAQAGHWRAAAGSWEAKAGKTAAERLEFARCLYAVGRFEDALEALSGLRRPAARILRLWSLYRLGKLGPAKRELKVINRRGMTARQRMQLLSVALRVFENCGESAEADRWLSEGLGEADPSARSRAELLSAFNAWDRGDLDAMRARLDRLEKSLRDAGEGDLGWRWRKAAGLEAAARGDGALAVGHFGQALRMARRKLTPFEAGALWNEMALGRAGMGDLAGAERALQHTLRLHRDVQGSRSTTSALFNLAEVRLRRGLHAGALDVLERATAEDRRSRNWRSLAHDFELWVLYELVRGRAHAALVRAREALQELEDRAIAWRTDEIRLLAARALGWLERPEEARLELDQCAGEAAGVLEAEEVPALWALAGDREAALAAVHEGDLGELWTSVLSGVDVDSGAWSALERIEPFRAGRLVFDIELVAPGSAPPAVLRRAVVALREAGAGPLAERLDTRDATAWRALGDFVDRRAWTEESLDQLFVDAGYPEARLLLCGRAGDECLRDGRGGARKLRRPSAAGELVLEAPYIDEVQKSLLAVLSQWIEPESAHVEGGRRRLAPAAGRRGGIVAQSQVMLAVLERADLLAAAEVPVMIFGETGTGKELLAREVHARSRHSDHPFLAMNCAAVSEELLMSDLFGHVKGSFTGADRDRVGIFEAARNGTVFLDEIGDLPIRAQGFLLRVLQEGEVRRVGENLPRKVAVRVVAATNRDLTTLIQQGGFRADLYYRLRVGALELPPLRERGRDVRLLADHFLRTQAGGAGEIGPRALARLDAYDWPGNVRELQNVLSVAAALAGGGAIGLEHLDLPYCASSSGPPPDVGYHELVQGYRRSLVQEALREAQGNRSEAARRLRLTRQALSYLVRKLELDS